MSNSLYGELEKLIKEYEEDFHTIRSERLVMKNYPKVLAMSSASSFEYQIKNCCQEFIDNPLLPINPNYPNITSLQGRKPIVDQMFAKLEGYHDSNGVEQLHAEKFYDFFGGQAFKQIVIANFNRELTNKLQIITNRINGLQSLLGQDDKYDYDYAKQCDLKDELERCTFEDAENSYLNLKLRRNRVAHDYINGLSDTFEDLQKFYNTAVIDVVALELSIISLTAPTT